MPKKVSSHSYGSLVFNDAVMQERLPKPTYKELMRVIHDNVPLDIDVANEVAHAMKEWAVEHGATHYTHWFQPLNGITSEKHDAFITPKDDGTALLAFSGKELVQGEPDASSFPNGGLRATFEARGYTAWDPTSPAFIKDEVLCIPTAFCSYTGEALDKKTPLLRSIVAVGDAAKRVLALFGQEPHSVIPTVGPEQEYFLIKEEDYAARPDLIHCGRTLFGCEPVKGQELEEHYFGAIRPTVNEFMKELDDELWRLGIPAKTKHNEVAPCQHELAPIFEKANVAIDHNLLTMELMKLLASHHGLVCLQHEKPFEYINGSGKHDNWSLSADGENLLDPGDTPEENLRFLIVLTCVIAAVDRHQDILRAVTATCGNDHRLGGHEAPPAIISIFLGDDLGGIVDAIIHDKPFRSHKRETMDLGVPALPDFLKDTTDRNRTSPFAFTGNKFEFRMCGSNQNLSDANKVLDTIVAEAFDDCYEALREVAAAGDRHAFKDAAMAWVKQTLTDHQRIIFNGDGYAFEWEAEAERRGLVNCKNTPEAVQRAYENPANVEVFERYGVLSPTEWASRYEVKLEQYAKLINIEANTMVYMARHMYLPALMRYGRDIMRTALNSKELLGEASPAEVRLARRINEGVSAISEATDALEQLNARVRGISDMKERSTACAEEVIPAMEALRKPVDEMEAICGRDYWPVPSYNKMLYYV